MNTFQDQRRRSRWRLLLHNYPLVIGTVIVVLIIGCAIAAPLLTLHDPNTVMLVYVGEQMKLPPYPPGSPHLPLGSDLSGRDILSRLLYGARPTLLLVAVATALRISIGIALGILGAWQPGIAPFVDALTSAWSAVPSLFFGLGIILVFFRNADVFASTLLFLIAISATGWTEIAIRCRSAIGQLERAAFVEAARALGRGRFAILWRHILPNLRDILVVEAVYSAAAALLLVAELGFLGIYLGAPEVGVTPRALASEPIYAEWASMLAIGLRARSNGYWLLIEPLVAVSLTILGFELIAEGLRRRR